MTDSFEMANSDDPEAIIKASQVSVIKAMRKVIREIKEDTKAPGLTWEQIDYLLEGFEKKDATVIYQEEPV